MFPAEKFSWPILNKALTIGNTLHYLSMASPILYTPLRYPGGKAKFAPFIESLFEANGLMGGHYLEPYAGGSAVALELLFHGYASEVHINDLDPAVYDFWISVVKHTEELLHLIRDTHITIDNWHNQKKILEVRRGFSQLERGFATFFLNRTNRSGILKGGVIGGKAQAGDWKLDARFNKINLMNRIERIAAVKDRIHVYNEDAKTLVMRCKSFLPAKSLIYLDPPYYVKGQELYRNFYMHQDHKDIREALDNVNRKWLVSYDNAPEIKKIYAGYKKRNYTLRYTAQEKKQGAEVMFFSKDLVVPRKQRKAA